MSEKEVLYTILEKIGTIKEDIAVIKTKQDQYFENHIKLSKEQHILETNHYKLKDEFVSYKSKWMLVNSLVSTTVGAGIASLINWFKT